MVLPWIMNPYTKTRRVWDPCSVLNCGFIGSFVVYARGLASLSCVLSPSANIYR
ncbi:hypothetical protein DsansV1_C01g0010821 [Dioscorea sansibarensis]